MLRISSSLKPPVCSGVCETSVKGPFVAVSPWQFVHAGPPPSAISPLELMADGGGPACTNCHGETATNGPFTDVSHTPEQTGGFSDDEILNIVLHGTFPEGGYFDPTIAPYAAWQNFHRWADIQPDQQRGIITYLRSLTPAPQKGQVNFGAFALDASMGVAGDTDAGAD